MPARVTKVHAECYRSTYNHIVHNYDVQEYLFRHSRVNNLVLAKLEFLYVVSFYAYHSVSGEACLYYVYRVFGFIMS